MTEPTGIDEAKIKGADDKVFARVWGYMETIGAAEMHFNSLQSNYRNLASIWLLSAFGGMGFIITADVPFVSEFKFWILGAVALLAALGLTILWVIDLLVYHQLLDAYFAQGLEYESSFDWLPQIRHKMENQLSGQGATPRVVLFYQIPIVVLILTSGVFFTFATSTLRPAVDVMVKFSPGGVMIILAVVISLVMRSKSKPAAKQTKPEPAAKS